VRQEAPKGPARVSSGVISGLKISGTNPTYPPIARAAHVSGAVVLQALISKEGTIKNLRVVSGPEMLRTAATEAVQTWRYKPYLLNGEPTEVDTQITVNFNFGGG
jgi:protein TonB